MQKSLVCLAVQLVEDLAEHRLDFINITLVCRLRDVGQGHLANVVIKALNGSGDVVQNPPAKRSGNAHDEIEQRLLIHRPSPAMTPW